MPNDKQALEHIQATAQKLKAGLSENIYGQETVIEHLLVGLFAEGHLLIEGIPGTAKTTLVKTLAKLAGLEFSRIQLTPDMLPAEVTGTSLYDLNTREFKFRKGPVFTEFLLADEINRTPPKTQSALLEAMEEHQVTVDGVKYELPELFTVVATLNPIEFEGTYPLPEAQLDRFMMKLKMSYPEEGAEKNMLKAFSAGSTARLFHHRDIQPVISKEDLLNARRSMGAVQVEESVLDYILKMIQDTRTNPGVELGCSPRSALALLAASRAHAAINGKDFVSPDNVKAVAPAVMRHRLILVAEAELDGLTPDDVIQQTMNRVPVPR